MPNKIEVHVDGYGKARITINGNDISDVVVGWDAGSRRSSSMYTPVVSVQLGNAEITCVYDAVIPPTEP